MKRLINYIKSKIKIFFKKVLKSPLKNDCIILSNNCIAALLYNDYCMKFNSPTINLQIMPDEFVRFCGNLRFYLNSDLVEDKNIDMNIYKDFHREGNPFPIAKLEDITIYFQHYDTFEDAKLAWSRRCNRVLKMVEDGYTVNVILIVKSCSKEMENNFSILPIKSKKIITLDEQDESSAERIKGLRGDDDWYSFMPGFTLKKYYEQINFIEWLKKKK
ncbi:MAG: DUF1919 domain-containing protein [Bacilli bacterium]